MIFIDLGRALAVTFMLYGHTVSALLAPRYQAGPWFDVWQFQRGLTSTLFLLLGGFAFSIATTRHWAAHVGWSPALLRRIRRFALFIALGYALHFPAARFADLASVSDARWSSFIAVDVLQLIGSTLILVQLMVLATRTRRAFTIACFVIGLVTPLVTPMVWAVNWDARLPSALAAYLSPAAGSLFPLFPWMGFVLLGAGFGQLYARWGAANLAAYAVQALLASAGVMLVAAGALRVWQSALFGAGPGSLVPAEALLRVGTCLAILAALAHLSRRIRRLPHIFGAVVQESLVIYFVHLCIVYGSVWNRGLTHYYGASLTPAQTFGWVAVVIGSMVGLAWYWNWFKHTHPQLARATSWVAGMLLLGALL